MPVLTGNDSEQLCLPVSVEGPGVAVESEEGEPVKILVLFLGVIVLLVVDLSLLF